jgi:hypothetical protein
LANLERESYFSTQVFNLSRGPMDEAFEPLSHEELQEFDRFPLCAQACQLHAINGRSERRMPLLQPEEVQKVLRGVPTILH